MMKKIKSALLIIALLSTYLTIFTTISYASKSNAQVIDIIKKLPLYYVFDIEKLQLENRENFPEYMKTQFNNYIKQLIDDNSYSVKIIDTAGSGDFNIHEWDADIKVYKGTTLIDTVQFRYENGTNLTMFGLITVPYLDTEKSESEKIAYVDDALRNRYKIDFQQCDAYEIEKVSQETEIVSLDSSINYSPEELKDNFYRIVCHNSNYTWNNEILIMQKKYTESEYKEYITNLIKNMPKYFGFDIDKFALEDERLIEYAKSKIETELNKYITDDSRRIEVDIIDYIRKLTSIELTLNVNIIKHDVLEDVISFNTANNNLIHINSFIGVPYGIEDILEYSKNILDIKLNYNKQYELEQYIGSMFEKCTILLETEKYGTYKALGNIYEFIPENNTSKSEDIVIIQKYGFEKGKGTEEEPYLISTPEELNAIRVCGSVYFKLINDIDLTYTTTNEKGIFYNKGKGWKPISNFSGVLDGNNKKIIGLTQNITNDDTGLFQNISNGKVKNLNLENISINANYDGIDVRGYYTSGLTSNLSGEIDNVLITGNIMINAKRSSGSYQASYIVGAVAGEAYHDSKISNAVNRVNIQIDGTADCGNYGGILGAGGSTKISNCINYGSIKSIKSGTQTGGIVGDINCNNGTSEILNCVNNGNLESRGVIGGIAGGSSGVTIKYCKNYGNLSSGTCIGGIAGLQGNFLSEDSIMKNGLIEECFNIGSINMNIEGGLCDTLGGITGTNSATIRNCFNAGIINISGANKDRKTLKQLYVAIGGLAGENDGCIYTSYSNDLGNAKFSGNLIQYMNINALAGKNPPVNHFTDYYAIENCYYLDNNLFAYTDINDEKIETDGKLTLEEMKKQESYIGFDFDNVWKIDTSGKYKLPRLINNDIDEEYLKIGDVNGDGKVNIKDWNMMYEYINETRELTEEEFNRADINGDCKVNLKDWNRLYEHVAEVNPLF